MAKHQLRYRTFNQLLEDVNVDFRTYALESMIEPQQLIKVARKINYDLGLRINETKEVVLEIEKGKAKLPEDFYVMNFGLLCGEYSVTNVVPSGTHIEEIPYTQYNPGPPPAVDSCTPPPETCPPEVEIDNGCHLENCGGQYKLIQKIRTQTRHYKYVYAIKFRRSQSIATGCPNVDMMAPNEAWIKDGWVYTSFETGNLYINYQGELVDDDGNILVPDHDLLNEYYEYALKDRILESLLFEGEDVAQKLQYVQGKLRMSRNNAKSLVNTPDFEELRKLHEVNRKAQYHKFYNMFRS
jgi:hypothetical protein